MKATPEPDIFIEIKGRLMIEGKTAMPGGVVSFFDVTAGLPPNHGNVRRIPDLVTQVGEDGSFTAKMLPGKFYLGSLNRKPEQGPGPPRPGEKLYFAVDDTGAIRMLEVLPGEKKDFGNISISPSIAFKDLADYFTVEGQVKDEAGKPVAGAMLMIKIDLESPRPDLISANTDREGRYRIKLPIGKSYHFIARNTINPGRPFVGSYVGTYNGPLNLKTAQESEEAPLPVPVTAKAGEIVTGIDIMVIAVPDPEKIKKQKQEDVAKQQESPEIKDQKKDPASEQKSNEKLSP
jgi:hypothetical protein